MKARLFCLFACLLAFSSSAFAQLVVQTVDVKGVNTGVVSRFTFRIDPSTNVLLVEVDNTIDGRWGVEGTITSFGFNTPFSNEQLGNKGSAVNFVSQTWTQKNPGHTNTTKWKKFEPYNLAQGGYTQDLGVGTGNTPTGGPTGNGIKHGEKVTFKFKLPDFGPEHIPGFFDKPYDIAVRWQEVGSDGCYEDSDYGKGNFPPIDAPPTPEPSTYGLMAAAALAGLVVYKRRKESKKA